MTVTFRSRLIPLGHNLHVVHVEVRHLRVILTVADSGSVSSAAAMLGVSQPALSAQLSRIENAFGGPLFARTRVGIEPTAVGDLVIHRARALVHDLDGLVQDVLILFN